MTKNTEQSLSDYANSVEVKILSYLTMNDEPIATIDLSLTATERDGVITFDVDPAIEALGTMERHVIPHELNVRYEESEVQDGTE